MSNIRIVPIQQFCMLCNDELPEHDTTHGLAGRLCQACVRLINEQMIVQEVKQHPKIVRVQ